MSHDQDLPAMSPEEFREAVAELIRQRRIYAIQRDGEIRFFACVYLGITFTETEAATALTAEQYLALDHNDETAPLN